MWTVLKGKWWFWIGIVLAIFIIWQSVSGAALTSKMWHMVKDQIVTDQSNIIKVKEEQEKWYENEIVKLNDQIGKIQKEKATIAASKVAADAEILRLKGKVNELEDAINHINVSSDPDTVIKSLQRRFPSIKRK